MILQELNAPELEDLTIKFASDYCLVMEEYLSNEEYTDIVNNLNDTISPFIASPKIFKFFKISLFATALMAFLLILASPFILHDTPVNVVVFIMFIVMFTIVFSVRCYIEYYKSNILKSGISYCNELSKKYEAKEIKFVFKLADMEEAMKFDTRILFYLDFIIPDPPIVYSEDVSDSVTVDVEDLPEYNVDKPPEYHTANA
ncbi:hypothetical protein BC833DRAFT_595477 [Globomyces pollinis-pini]|nr:hypothetical protein BC833DRAFT_595477 [Globomyces pollinis-pini]